MEHLPLDNPLYPVVPVCRSVAVGGIPEERMPDGTQMHSDLVHPSGFEPDFQEAEPIAATDAPIMGYRFLSRRIDPDFRFVLRVFHAEKRTLHRSFSR